MPDSNWVDTGAVAARETAPGRLALVQEFINTLDVMDKTEEFSDPEGLRAWLAAKGLGQIAVDLAGFGKAVALREALRRMILANNGGPLYPVDLATLNQLAADARIRLRFSGSGARLEPEAEGLDAALGRLVVAVQGAMADGTWGRLKACPRDDCRWAFYDSSKNHSATWCSMQVCGNRAKASRYRERLRSGV